MPALDEARSFVTSTWLKVAPLDDDGESPVLDETYEEGLILAISRVCHLRANEIDRATEMEKRVIRFVEECVNENAFTGTEHQERVIPYVQN
jgi:hypothetical protein